MEKYLIPKTEDMENYLMNKTFNLINYGTINLVLIADLFSR